MLRISFMILLSVVISASAVADESVDNHKKLDDFENVAAFEAHIEEYQKACQASSGGGAAAARCYWASKLWDRELNLAYKKLRKRLDGAEKEKLKEMQLAWIASRDSTIEVARIVYGRHYDSEGTWWIGSRASGGDRIISNMTQQRALLLRRWERLLAQPLSSEGF